MEGGRKKGRMEKKVEGRRGRHTREGAGEKTQLALTNLSLETPVLISTAQALPHTEMQASRTKPWVTETSNLTPPAGCWFQQPASFTILISYYPTLASSSSSSSSSFFFFHFLLL